MTILGSSVFTGTNGAAWGSEWTVGQSTGASAATIDSNRGKIQLSQAGSYTDRRTELLNGVSSTANIILEGTVEFPNLTSENFAQAWVRCGSDVATNGYFFSLSPFYGDVGLFKRVGGTQTDLGSGVAFSWAANTVTNWKIEATGTTIRGKVWTGAEPGTWTISRTDTSHSAGFVGVSLDGGGSTSQVYSCFFDAVTAFDNNAIVIATTIARTATVPTPSMFVNATPTPTTIARTVSMPSPTIAIPNATATPSTIARSVTIPTPTVVAHATVAAASIVPVVSLPTPNLLQREWGPVPEYRVQSRLRDGTYVADLPYRNLQFELGWNRGFGIRFEVPSTHPVISPATLKPGLHEIWVYRNGVLVTAGPLWDIVVSSENASISCNAMSLLDYLDVRLIDTVQYNVVDQTQIAWDLINDSQAHTDGNLYLSAGTLSTGITRSAKWSSFDNKYVLEALIDFSEMNEGFDFYIDPATRTFTALYPRPQRDQGLQLIFPYHFRRYSMQYQGKYIRNRIRVQATEPTFIEAVDTTSRSEYGLRDYADSYKDAGTVTDLTAYASKLRDRRKDVWDYPSVVVNTQVLDIFDPTVIKYGDIVRIQISDGYVQYDRDMRYTTAQISVDKQGAESVVIYLQDTRELE